MLPNVLLSVLILLAMIDFSLVFTQCQMVAGYEASIILSRVEFLTFWPWFIL